MTDRLVRAVAPSGVERRSLASAVRIAALGAAVALVPSAVGAQAPTIARIEPPNWWTGHSINPVRVLVRGTHLTGATVRCAVVRCGTPKVNAAGTAAFVDVTIPRTLAAGPQVIELRTASGLARATFAIQAPLAREGRFQGFSPQDAIYLAIVDRFANGDPGNDNPAISPGLLDRAKGRYYHGGDLAGLRGRLPYLKELGITAIWVTPLNDNMNTPNVKQAIGGNPVTDYHGYGATDFYALEEHFGDLPGFKALVDEAHRLGLKVILDMVANHTGPEHPWVTDPPTPSWFNGTAASHLNNTWQVWTIADPHATDQIRARTLQGWFNNVLPDLNQDDPEVARYLIQNTLWWTAMSGIDAIRQDTWPYVPRTFWRDWMAAIKREYPGMRVVGEVWDGDPSVLAFFEGTRPRFDGVSARVDALFDFPLFYSLRRAFANGGSLAELTRMIGRDHLYDAPNHLVTFLGLHDVSRFMHDSGATTDGLQLAFTFLLTARGTPLLYYGDEIALPGGDDPDNRRDFPGGWAGDARDAFTAAGRTAAENAVFDHVRALLHLRRERVALASSPMQLLVQTDGVLAYRRGATVVVLNNGATPADVAVPVAALGAPALGRCAVRAGGAGSVLVSVAARSGCVF